jgi:hypothetical protein
MNARAGRVSTPPAHRPCGADLRAVAVRAGPSGHQRLAPGKCARISPLSAPPPAPRLENDLETLMTHLLQWQCQPQSRSGNWQAVIQNARSNINDRLEDSPRLASRLRKLIGRAYRKSRRSAGAGMGLTESQWEARFRRDCPWDIGSLRRSDFWPDNHAPNINPPDSTRRFQASPKARSRGFAPRNRLAW